MRLATSAIEAVTNEEVDATAQCLFVFEAPASTKRKDRMLPCTLASLRLCVFKAVNMPPRGHHQA
jgi:hypothetical protein